MRTGSRGIGGRRYQIAAALFTYAAVSMAALPIYFSQISKDKATKPPQVKTAPANPGGGADDAERDDAASSSGGAAKPKMSPFAALGLLALLGLASPFLELQDPFHGAIGLIILFVGIRFAWQQTGAPKIDIVGPFQNRAPTLTPAT
jgi:hypothetical protein